MQRTFGVTEQTALTEKRRRAIMKNETKLFLEELYQNLNLVLDSLEGQQHVFWLFETDVAKGTILIRFGSTLGITELPKEVLTQVMESEKALRAKEDSEPTKEVHMTLEGTIPQKPTKTLEQRIKEMEDARPEPKEVKKDE
jgi:hypothetical protein